MVGFQFLIAVLVFGEYNFSKGFHWDFGYQLPLAGDISLVGRLIQ